MKNLWSDTEAQAYQHDSLQMRVYSSRLLGANADLVLHGGGNTSVKANATNLFGDTESVLYVKGSGWDLATIEGAGFAPVKLDVLQRMATLDTLSDSDMVNGQRSAMLNPNAPNPSVEAILHAVIPFKYVDHTHADAVVALSNMPDGEQRIRAVYGDKVLVIPYVMPGFILAKTIHEHTQDLDWSTIEGMVLMHHGIFSFSDDAKTSYDNMITLVTQAEEALNQHHAFDIKLTTADAPDLKQLAKIRRAVSNSKGCAMIACLNDSEINVGFSALDNAKDISTRGCLTPDHVIRTKRLPMWIETEVETSINDYVTAYKNYFNQHTTGDLTCLSPEPRWAVWAEQGTISFGTTYKDAQVINDITHHTVQAIQWAENVNQWQALPAKDIFELEYWELEQAKLNKNTQSPPLQGKIAIVTGAANGIGKACADMLHQQGAVVVALDINPIICDLYQANDFQGVICDVTDDKALQAVIEHTVKTFGGLDILISNAGTFPSSCRIEDMDAQAWNTTLAVNLTSHQRLLQLATPYLKQGIQAAVVFIASKNVPAPGPGASAYSTAKAGLTQLARVAALELAGDGIRVNVLHPNAVFDTAIWTEEVLNARASHYGLSVADYKANNLLHQEVTSNDVATLACAMVGDIFAKTTGAQVPVDGGNERVI